MHIHLIDFKIIGRNGRAPFAYEKGPKDTVYVGEGETVRLLMKFGPHQGRYMVHCHNLVHEDHDMMAQYQVGESADPDPNDPMTADPAVPAGTSSTTPSPTPSPSPSASPTPSVSPSATSSPSASPSPTPTPTKKSGKKSQTKGPRAGR